MRLVSYLLLFGLLLSQACVDSFTPNLTLNTTVVVINALLTDQPDQQPITLNLSTSRRDSANFTTPLSRATVTVLVNGATALTLAESPTEPGTYRWPAEFRGVVGSTYQLRFRTAAGVTYESAVETMSAAPPISRVYDTFNPTGLKPTADAAPIPTNDVFIDFTDPADSRNFYLWRWRLYEVQAWCATCTQGRYIVRDIGPVGSGPIEVIGCVADKTLPYNNLFDYACRDLCWEIFYSSRIDILSDVYTNGTRQVGHKIASVPIYQRNPALLTIEQLAISPNAYRYYQLLANQVQNTGTLADSPPAPLAGNVRNLADPSENIVGYFSAAAVSVYPYKINRQNLPLTNLRGLFYMLNNRAPNVDNTPGDTYGHGVPSALCVDSRTRTPNLPAGWNQ